MDKNSIINSHLKLESIDVNPKGRIGAMIKISDNEILVIESRRPSIYSIFPKGFAGITVTKVDTSKIYSRFDRSVDGFAWEKKQWSYYVRTDQQKSPEWIVSEQIPSRVLGYEGESFTIDGINISLKKSGKFDDISISISN